MKLQSAEETRKKELEYLPERHKEDSAHLDKIAEKLEKALKLGEVSVNGGSYMSERTKKIIERLGYTVKLLENDNYCLRSYVITWKHSELTEELGTEE
jgi:hypothetical protein